MDRLAAKLKVAKGTLYLYFPSKEELFCACVDHGMRRLQVSLHAAAAVEDELLEKIAAGIFAYLQFFDEHSYYAELLIQERAIFRNRKRPSYFEHRDSNRGVWGEVYRNLIEEGRVRGDLPIERIMDTVGNLLYGSMFTNHFIGKSTTPAVRRHLENCDDGPHVGDGVRCDFEVVLPQTCIWPGLKQQDSAG